MDYGNKCCEKKKKEHVHEFLGSTFIAELGDCPHNHRFAGVSSEAIPTECGSHRHKIITNTDSFKGHYHNICDESGPAVKVGDGHIHYVTGYTTRCECHCHEYTFATLIDDPIQYK